MKRNNTDVSEIKTLLIIIAIIILVVIGLYYFTESSLNKKKAKEENKVPEISYKETILGNIFNLPLKEYYIIAYNKDADKASNYEKLYNTYSNKEVALPIYVVDLSLKFNSFSISEITNKKPNNASEVAIKEAALILIKDGKVSKYFESIEEMEMALK
ncbi:MAG: hypothetical protein PHD03_04925 [Bacilli bacterium]|nr:hypothetical protein [Bacilli bacterium]MDD4407350.1 hypothetical protein [Bacilli bacterium]